MMFMTRILEIPTIRSSPMHVLRNDEEAPVTIGKGDDIGGLGLCLQIILLWPKVASMSLWKPVIGDVGRRMDVLVTHVICSMRRSMVPSSTI
jgi:hypothetical protein